MNFKTRNKVSAEFNMASLADVIFLLLIFFMLTSQLVAPNAIKLLLPNAEGQTLSKKNVEVSITEDLRFYVGSKLVPFDRLQSEIASAISNIDDPVVVLRVDKLVPVDQLVQVLNVGRKLRVKMILATQPKE